jgi:hypothetical protein
MSIKFSPGKPSEQELLDQAAGVGLNFEKNSMEAWWFVTFCNQLWVHGYVDGVDGMRKTTNQTLEQFRTQSLPN